MTRRARPLWVDLLLLALSAALIVVFVQLGNWQIRRLAWKQELIAAVETRAFGVPIEISGDFDFEADAHRYLRVRLSGMDLPEHVTLVKAVTELGPGFWVMIPRLAEGRIVWINHGFVPQALKDPDDWTGPELDTPVVGLLRAGEASGTVLETNQPEKDRWVSRDLAAMSRAAGLGDTAPFFVDAEASGHTDLWPRGGLTIIAFRNTHLAYAMTWYAMAILFAAALIFVLRRRLYRADADHL